MKLYIITFASLIITNFCQAQSWVLDKSHSKLGFSIEHLGINETEGFFKDFDANIVSFKEDFIDAKITLTAQAGSINTLWEDRDKMLKSEKFFDSARYPVIIFNSKSFDKLQNKDYTLTGDLTMHGITQNVTLDVVFRGVAFHPAWKKTVAGFKIRGTIKRSDYGISAGVGISDEVSIIGNVEFFKQ